MDTKLTQNVAREEARGIAKWGGVDTSPAILLNAATEELGEVAHAINHDEGKDRIAQEITEVIGILSRLWSMVTGHALPIVGDEPIHDWFSLSYAQYLTIPRTALQSMPVEWQLRFVECLEQLDEMLDWRPKEGRYYCFLKGKDGKFMDDPLCDYERGRRRIPLTKQPA